MALESLYPAGVSQLSPSQALTVNEGYSCWKYALEAIIKGLLLYFLVHDNCLLFIL